MIHALKETPRISTRNHPENAPPAEARSAGPGLGAIIALCAFCGLIGMTVGTAALSTAMLAEGWGELFSSVPIIAAAVAILTGWTGAVFCMIREDRENEK